MPWRSLNNVHDSEIILSAQRSFTDFLEERLELVSGIHRDLDLESLSNANVRNGTAERLVDLRLELDAALALHRRHQSSDGDLTDALNHLVATLTGYFCSVLANHTDAAPEFLGRAQERLECFLEEMHRAVVASLPDCEWGYGLKAIAWDGKCFVVR